MNLIGNTCVSSYITKCILREQFNNPFVWNIIKFDSCYNLVKYWDEINFDNYTLTKDDRNNFMLFIDGKVKIRYIHYKFDKTCTVPTRRNSDIYYNKIKEYIIQKYIDRLKRMREHKESPTFIFVKPNGGLPNSINEEFTLAQQEKLASLDTPYKIIISFKHMIKTDKLITVPQTTIFKNNGIRFATFIYEKALLHNTLSTADTCKIFKEPLQLWYSTIMHKPCNIDNPHTLTEKIQWLKVYDCIPLKTKCSDKIQLHDYVTEKLNKDICIPIIKTYDTANGVNLKDLPERFVIKANHGSGMNLVVKNKQTLNTDNLIRTLQKWFDTDYSFNFGYEFQYRDIPHKVLVEEYKENKGQSDLIDYKFYCFNGNPHFCQIITNRHSGEMISHYDLNWTYKPEYDQVNFKSTPNLIKPKKYTEMIEYAKKLSEDFKFVRVDFYEIDNVVYLGELTFTPLSGVIKYKDQKIDEKLGSLLQL